MMTLVLLVITGCATLGGANTEETVKQRVAERWNALIDGRLETAYSYETPEYREVYSYSDYRKTVYGVGKWRKAEVEALNCTGKNCVVTIVVYVNIVFARGLGSTETHSSVREQWIQSSTTGEWYHVSNH
jgi:hypothetical protein